MVVSPTHWPPLPFTPIVLKSGSLNLLELSGPVQACNGTALPFIKKSHVFTLNTDCSRTTVYMAKSNYGRIQTGLIKLKTMTLLHNFACLPAELEYRPWIQGEVNSWLVPCQPDFQYKSVNKAESSTELVKYRTLINVAQQFRCWCWHRRRPGITSKRFLYSLRTERLKTGQNFPTQRRRKEFLISLAYVCMLFEPHFPTLCNLNNRQRH
jgi:hypothetical protein